jgi:hypothetical protein
MVFSPDLWNIAAQLIPNWERWNSQAQNPNSNVSEMPILLLTKDIRMEQVC